MKRAVSAEVRHDLEHRGRVMDDADRSLGEGREKRTYLQEQTDKYFEKSKTVRKSRGDEERE